MSPITSPIRIATMGDMVMDIIAYTDHPDLHHKGETVGRIRYAPGGSAANFAVWAARTLGPRGLVSFIGKVGLDMTGPVLIEHLQREGVQTCVQAAHDTSALSTGSVLVVSSAVGGRFMISDPGAGRRITVAEVEACLLAGPLHAFFLTSYSLFTDPPRPAALRACQIAHERGAIVCFDTSSTNQMTALGMDRFGELVREVAPDLIIPTLDEAAILTGKHDPAAAAAALHQYAPLVALKLGGEGCLISHADGWQQHLPAVPTEVADVTGAGDAFAAAFISNYLLTGDAVTAGQAANALGARVVGMIGAR